MCVRGGSLSVCKWERERRNCERELCSLSCSERVCMCMNFSHHTYICVRQILFYIYILSVKIYLKKALVHCILFFFLDLETTGVVGYLNKTNKELFKCMHPHAYTQSLSLFLSLSHSLTHTAWTILRGTKIYLGDNNICWQWRLKTNDKNQLGQRICPLV